MPNPWDSPGQRAGPQAHTTWGERRPATAPRVQLGGLRLGRRATAPAGAAGAQLASELRTAARAPQAPPRRETSSSRPCRVEGAAAAPSPFRWPASGGSGAPLVARGTGSDSAGRLSPQRKPQREDPVAEAEADVFSLSTRTPSDDSSATLATVPSGASRGCGSAPRGRGIVLSERSHKGVLELMHNKDKLRVVSETPFKERGSTRLGLPDFTDALRETLLQLGLRLPSDGQIYALFEKHGHGGRGVDIEDFGALLFRLLCFMRAKEDVDVPTGQATTVRDRDRRWRQDFISRNPRQFTDVYQVQSKLGQGTYGKVYQVCFKNHGHGSSGLASPSKFESEEDTQTTDGNTTSSTTHDAGMKSEGNREHTRVCKVISKSMAKHAGMSLDRVREELNVLKRLDHPHTLRIFENFEDDHNFFLIMERALGGDLKEYMRTMGPTDGATYERWVAQVMHQTISAMSYCHGRGVVHKDLKLDNVMLSTPPGTPLHAIHVVVVDFGLSEVFSGPEARSRVVSGTPPYMAPEVWTCNSGKACDLWSCGVMLFFMLSGRFPFHGQTPEEFAQATATQEPTWALMGGASAEAHDLCKQLLIKSDVFRATARQAVRHPWFEIQSARGSDAGCSKTSLGSCEVDSLMMLPERSEFEKFLSRIVATQVDAAPRTNINAFFRAMDTRNDGVLATDVLKNGLVELGITPPRADQVARELDVARRGCVSYTEFLAGCLDLRTRSPTRQDEILQLAWQQFLPNANGDVRANDVQNALAARGMTVANLPPEFLSALKKESSGLLTFDWFKRFLQPEIKNFNPPVHESTSRRSLMKRPDFLENLLRAQGKTTVEL